ncbi:hypothetical protein ACQKJC_18510 [Priestia koreensis]|uniref:hypothetical protein n=1 Tax=Priestia koreensis TaxID=284581 RepID=UPI003D037375
MKKIRVQDFTDTTDDFQQFKYLLNFVQKNILSVTQEDNQIVILHEEEDDTSIMKEIEHITSKISGSRKLPFQNETVYKQNVSLPFHDDILSELIEKKIVVKTGDGLFTFRPPFSDLILFLDQLIVDHIAKPLGAQNEYYPTLISLNTLNKTNHFTSFPHHVLFTQHLKEDFEVIDNFSSSVKENNGLSKEMIHQHSLEQTDLVKNPAVCYHCYQALEDSDLESSGKVVTAVGRCSRYESNNHSEFGRLLDFSMREVIFVGNDEFVQRMREKSIDLLKEFIKIWQLDSYLENANDPFFTDDYKVKSFFQRDMHMKYELRLNVPYTSSSLSAASSNYHGNVFGKAFSVKTDGEYASTGCLAFGLERWIFAFLAQYGIEVNRWPASIQNLYQDWANTYRVQA